MTLVERDYLLLVKAAHSIGSIPEMLAAFTALAALYIERGETQEGADVLAFVLQYPDCAEDTREQAQELWDDLERYICPRVLVDATDFASKADLLDLVEYVFAGT